MIRLHMLHHHVVQLPPVENMRYVFEKHFANGFVYRVKEDRLLV